MNMKLVAKIIGKVGFFGFLFFVGTFGLYMFNGQRNPCTLEDGVLCFSTNGGNIFFAYAGPIE